MSKKEDILYIFDLQNTHEEYAKCLEFITILQRQSSIGEKENQFKRICQLSETINIAGVWAPDYAKNYYEEPLKLNGSISTPIISEAKKLRPESIQRSILDRSLDSMQFHIRVNLGVAEKIQVGNLSNLHYLALLLQRIDHILALDQEESDKTNRLKQRVSVFIVPFSQNYYPFTDSDGNVDFETYQLASTYLRLLSKRYTGIIYGVVQREDSIAVRALDFHRTSRLTDSFPLIPLNRQTYQILFDQVVTQNAVDALFSLKKNRRVVGANDADPYKAFNPFITETAYNHFRDRLPELINEKDFKALKLIENEIKNQVEKKHISLFSFTIFLFTLCITEQSEESIRTAIQQNMEFAEELSSGLRQLAQNTLQHSACHEGVISFYLEHSGEDISIRIFLSDFNNQQTFIDNFVSNLIREVGYTDNEELKQRYTELSQNAENVTLGYFFGEYEPGEPNESWVNFRQADTSAHIGLLLFAMTMQRCGGTVQLINSTGYSALQQNCFFRCYASKNELQSTNCMQIIPGSHLELTVPVGTIEEQRPMGLGQLSLTQPIHETYKSFAIYLDYQPIEVDFSSDEFQCILQEENGHCTKTIGITSATDAAAKYETIYCWEKYWTNQRSILNDKHEDNVYYFNIDKLPAPLVDSEDKIEIFIKGFINSLAAFCQGSRPFLFAFTNVSKLFLNTFRQVTISLSPKKFPSNLQLYIIQSELTESIHLLGDTFCQAIANAYSLSLEHGTQAYSLKEVDRARNLIFINKIPGKVEQDTNQLTKMVCPFDAILRNSKEGTLSLFDKQISRLADLPLDKPQSGYKLDNIHMRLGSKIHIRAFYEMAFLFYRTSISNRIAFEILKNLRESTTTFKDNTVNLLEDDLLFYGYASYSKALLTSIIEILKEYRVRHLNNMLTNTNNEKEKIAIEMRINQVSDHLAYASYQHNLQSDFQVEDTELYFNFYSTVLGERLDKDRVCFNSSMKIIQIVPISSTLTTFDKMETRLQAALEGGSADNQVKTVARYTVFWVTDKRAESEDVPRKETEAKYWKKVDITHRQILLGSKNKQGCVSPITYFMRSLAVWEDPLQCELCYPENVIAEVPLVETDQTSTVPAHQLRGLPIANIMPRENSEENDRRLIKLRSCVSYGHIRREKNHFQFYVETQNYFNQVNTEVQRWLEGLRDKEIQQDVSVPAVLNIIFSPEHATNVGFAQYVV